MTTSTKTQKFDLYQDVTNRIIAALETGTAPWLKPWNAPDCNLDLPRNAVSNRFYNGVNILLLWLSASEHGYRQSKWITAKKANELGGYICKGEKATRVVNYRPVEKEVTDDIGNLLVDDEGNPVMEQYAILTSHFLFNIEQCEKLPLSLYEQVIPKQSNTIQYREFAEIQLMIDGMGLTVESKPSNRAYYSPKDDKVVMPEMEQFNYEAGYYSTLLHEMTHASGHRSRLCREGIIQPTKFGSKRYAFEELVAEMGGAFLCAHIGFNTVPQNASYLTSWLELLKSDKRAIFKATGKAREACQYMFETLTAMQQSEQYTQLVA